LAERRGVMRKWMRGYWQVLALGLLLGSAAGAAALTRWEPLARDCPAPAGTLDETFGTGGKVLLDLGGFQDVIVALAVQEDGRILAAGSSFIPGEGPKFALVRFLPDGSLDPSFGAGGVVIANGTVGDMVLLEDGRILVAGSSGGDQLLARFLPDGSLDPSFGTGGIVTTDFSGNEDRAEALAIQRDGKLLVLGNSTTPDLDSDFSLTRYLPDGQLDPSFGEGGKVLLDFFGAGDVAADLVILPDGSIVVGGSVETSSGRDFVLARVDRYGRLDPSFGEDGRITLDIAGSEDWVTDLALAPGNRIVAVGTTFTPGLGWDFVIARFDHKGRLDARFGTGGVVTLDFSSEDQAQAVAVQKDGSLVVAGRIMGPTNPDFGLVRLTRGGQLDETFGTGGRVLTDFSGGIDTPIAVTIQPDGRILAGGFSRHETGDFALARYLGECKTR
jgi:uncharacterized delta-60 repeat protein